jgi:hypothetical protein
MWFSVRGENNKFHKAENKIEWFQALRLLDHNHDFNESSFEHSFY